MKNSRGLVKLGLSCAIVGALYCSLCPAIATAGTVRGHGKVLNGPGVSTSEISVDAWTDDLGVAQGTVVFTGGSQFSHPGGPTDPWLLEVTDIVFDGNTAYVVAVVVHSVFPPDIGTAVFAAFVDNSGYGVPDEISISVLPVLDFIPIVAGNITVTD